MTKINGREVKTEELTADQKKEIEEAKKHPIQFDEDCPELSPAMMKALRVAVRQRNRRNELRSSTDGK